MLTLMLMLTLTLAPFFAMTQCLLLLAPITFVIAPARPIPPSFPQVPCALAVVLFQQSIENQIFLLHSLNLA